jgi:hypothetical protein
MSQKITSWEEPTFSEINLDAEIGSYQEDFGDVPVTIPQRGPAAESGGERAERADVAADKP